MAARTGHRVVVVEGLCLPRCCGCEASSSSASSSPTAGPGAGPADETSCSPRPNSLLSYLQQQQQQQQPPCGNQCFMFRSRRSGLVKRLWKHRRRLPEQRQQDEAGGPPQAAPSSTSSSGTHSSAEDLELKATMHSFLKRLKEPQLQALVSAVESDGADSAAPGGCVLLPRGDTVRLGRRSVQPHVLSCHIWRFPAVGLHGDSHNTTTNAYSDSSDVHLKPLPCCSNNYNHSNGSNNNNSCRSNNGNNTLSSSSSSLLSSPGQQQQQGGNNPSSTTTSSSTTSSTTLICCNPYHWSRVLEPGENFNVNCVNGDGVKNDENG